MKHTISHKHIWSLAWPMILSNISVPLLGIVDTAILGHLPQPRFLAAVALGASIVTFAFWAFGFLRMGTTSFVAQAFGAKDTQKHHQVIGHSLILAVAIGITLALLQFPPLELILWVMGPDEILKPLAQEYAQIRFLSAPAVMINYVIMGHFLGIQQTRIPLIITLVINGLNIVLDYLLIIVLGMNSAGAAWATVIADYTGLAVGLGYLGRHLAVGSIVKNCLKSMDFVAFRQLITVNRHLFVRTASLLFVFLFIATQGAKQGEVILAANAILLQLLAMTSYGLDGFAHAAETLVGESVGQRSPDKFWATCRRTTYWSLITALLMTGIFILCKPLIILLMTDIESVRQATSAYYTWLIVLPIISVWAYQLDGIFIGLGESATLMRCMLLALLGVFLPLWYFTLPLANHGLWLSFITFNGARGISLGWYLLKKERKRFH